MTPRKRLAVASIVLATGAALVGVSAAVAQSGTTPDLPTSPGESGNEHGKHLGWAKVIENDSQGRHLGWNVHGQHGGAPAEEGRQSPGKSGESHGRAGEDHGKAGDRGRGAEKNKP
ncbi:MAG TPA: hypothetical protein VFK41_05045 [Nocardioidaceae bacterium]|nr:hypothetical protein [Nocardioidaceae bacterium]